MCWAIYVQGYGVVNFIIARSFKKHPANYPVGSFTSQAKLSWLVQSSQHQNCRVWFRNTHQGDIAAHDRQQCRCEVVTEHGSSSDIGRPWRRWTTTTSATTDCQSSGFCLYAVASEHFILRMTRPALSYRAACEVIVSMWLGAARCDWFPRLFLVQQDWFSSRHASARNFPGILSATFCRNVILPKEFQHPVPCCWWDVVFYRNYHRGVDSERKISVVLLQLFHAPLSMTPVRYTKIRLIHYSSFSNVIRQSFLIAQ